MKTFLSIGAGPGMGFATAERFAKEGFQVVLAARNAAKTQQLADKLKSKGYTAEARTVDSGDPESVAKLVAEVEKQYGSIDVLHYNAASVRQAALTEQPRDTFVKDLAVNIGGALVAAQSVAAKMEARRSGAILLTGGGWHSRLTRTICHSASARQASVLWRSAYSRASARRVFMSRR